MLFGSTFSPPLSPIQPEGMNPALSISCGTPWGRTAGAAPPGNGAAALGIAEEPLTAICLSSATVLRPGVIIVQIRVAEPLSGATNVAVSPLLGPSMWPAVAVHMILTPPSNVPLIATL